MRSMSHGDGGTSAHFFSASGLWGEISFINVLVVVAVSLCSLTLRLILPVLHRCASRYSADGDSKRNDAFVLYFTVHEGVACCNLPRWQKRRSRAAAGQSKAIGECFVRRHQVISKKRISRICAFYRLRLHFLRGDYVLRHNT